MAFSGNDRATAGKAPRQRGGTFVCIASGPSLQPWQCEYIQDKAARIIACNTSYQAVRPPAIAYGCDWQWWKRYQHDAKEKGFECWTQDINAAARFKINLIQVKNGRGLCRDEMTINHGANSGFQAIGLAYALGADRIILIGYDMQHTGGKSHWHGDHPKGLTNAYGIKKWVKNFEPLAYDLAQEGVEVINCTIETALDCFKRDDLRNVL